MLQLRKPFQFDSVALIVLAIIAVDVYGQTTTKSTLATLEPASKKIEQVPDGVDAKIWKRLVDLGVKAGKIKDLQASFVQEKHTVLLKKPLVSSGTLKVMGRVMLWETLKPHPSAVWMDGRQVKMYYPADQLVEIYPLGAKASMPAWPLLQPVAMARQFRIQPVPQGHKKMRANGRMPGLFV